MKLTKELESFAPYYSQSLVQADFKKIPYSTLALKLHTKKSTKQERGSLL
jgi:hypothetical protein